MQLKFALKISHLLKDMVLTTCTTLPHSTFPSLPLDRLQRRQNRDRVNGVRKARFCQDCPDACLHSSEDACPFAKYVGKVWAQPQGTWLKPTEHLCGYQCPSCVSRRAIEWVQETNTQPVVPGSESRCICARCDPSYRPV